MPELMFVQFLNLAILYCLRFLLYNYLWCLVTHFVFLFLLLVLNNIATFLPKAFKICIFTFTLHYDL